MTDERATFEHADHTVPRTEHGYCTDDMARVLVVASREPEPDQLVKDLAAKALRFVTQAQGSKGDFLNRRGSQGQWSGQHMRRDRRGNRALNQATHLRSENVERRNLYRQQ
jgi:hypothetical protein